VTVSDNINGTWSLVESINNSNIPNTYAAIFYFVNSQAGSVTVTVATSSNAVIYANVEDWSGILAAAPLDAVSVAGNTTPSATPNSGSTPALALANELVVGISMVTTAASVTPSAGSGFTLDFGNTALGMEYQIVNSTNPIAATFTLSGSTYWSAAVATFKGGTQITIPLLGTILM
jgi:hypothetical protein